MSRFKREVSMKIYEFINIISSHFSNEIFKDDETNRMRAALKYQTVLTWFTAFEADEKEHGFNGGCCISRRFICVCREFQ